MSVIKTIHAGCLFLLVFSFNAIADPQDRVFFNYNHFNNATEAVQMQMGVFSPGEAIPGNMIITHDWTVRDRDGEKVGQFRTETPAAGFAEVTFAVRADGGEYNLFANDQRLGAVQPDTFGRVSYKIEAKRSTTGRNPQTGETVQLKAKTVPGVATAIIDKFTGETRAVTYQKYALNGYLSSK
jgi:hypothetical protein